MTARDFLAFWEKSRGHFYFRVGRNLWDVLWTIEVIGWNPPELRLHWNFSTRYRGNGICRGRAPHEVVPELQELVDEMERVFAAFLGGAPLVMPAWAYEPLVVDTAKRFFASAP